MPDAQWYEQMYGGRDAEMLPLEPGHKYFLADQLSRGTAALEHWLAENTCGLAQAAASPRLCRRTFARTTAHPAFPVAPEFQRARRAAKRSYFPYFSRAALRAASSHAGQ